ncbi:MAG TPA: DegT/DnrJ/EryC1/StrS family aminotransferase [Armatimonadota bacterium]|nr:DegT/DnrJ/EryC1/StrS family aminotransferase [Armatimonadota bacterium]
MKVPFLDLKDATNELSSELEAAALRVVRSGWYVLGKEVESFEAEFAAYCGARGCIGTGNGLEALHLILRALDIGPGDEVIVPSNTYIATWLAVSYAGALPVPVEPDPLTRNLDPDRVEAAITPRTRAILAVHLYGLPAVIAPLAEIAKRHNLYLLDDAAQGHGARYQGRRVGALAHASGFSFYPTKNLGALGDGGAVVSDDPELLDRVKVLRNYGSRRKYQNEVKGVNSRLDEMQAALLRAKLPKLDEWNQRRARLAEYYLQALAGIPGLRLPVTPANCEPAWHDFVIQYAQRDALQEYLKQQGIGTLIYYPVPPHLSEAYADLGFGEGSFPIAEELARTNLAIPIGPQLSLDAAQYVVQTIRDFTSRLNG